MRYSITNLNITLNPGPKPDRPTNTLIITPILDFLTGQSRFSVGIYVFHNISEICRQNDDRM